jgi:hypothetical protein
LGRGRRLWQCAWRANSTHRQHRGAWHSPGQLQRRVFLHSLPGSPAYWPVRHPLRATQSGGITLWETTLAEALKQRGYATALFGKWHLGGANWIDGRTPIDQGFDEWYGIPNTSNEAQWMSAPELRPRPTDSSFIWEQKSGQAPRRVTVFDTDTRRLVDREAARRGAAFIERNARAHTPFFLYYPMTQIHFPTLSHPDFAGKTGAGDIGDAMADMDYNVGLILNARQGRTRPQRDLVARAVPTASGAPVRYEQTNYHGHSRRRRLLAPDVCAR